ncbi:hypothetical protein K493DRAFT_341818 [Basidiobolus meristosporus CBS 931.73]|uniref:Uncharacterized protein n=1 Tax=Basidiobolus meristosporus CBS 931.73 TaxID=1314790 RepID=A0A1Y1XHI8_9FUNG|nr:hypothetical protein K493DRAFT_341818 [Basidiobolus meristosporus CBS 931.73]|eukprot:ORX85219.1 hypothetical protein K493DRAFT_341818 [Basidiobolus meristosporus CBS 931.73]
MSVIMGPFQPKYTDPPLCFCHKPAACSTSINFGTIFECHYVHEPSKCSSRAKAKAQRQMSNIRIEREIDSIVDTLRELSHEDSVSFSDCSYTPHSENDSQPKICGFHIHKKAWDSFFFGKMPPYRYNDNFEHKELKLCPYFNFTFCVYFRLSNPFAKQYHITPTCFCGQNVTINRTYREGKNYRRYGFGCPNYKRYHSREKCTWFLWAEDLRFERPLENIHATYPPDKQRSLSPSPEILEPMEVVKTSSSSTSSDTDCLIDITTPGHMPDPHSVDKPGNGTDVMSKLPGPGEPYRSSSEFHALEMETEFLHSANKRLHQVIHESRRENMILSKRVSELELCVKESRGQPMLVECRVCYERLVTHAIVPCFHLALCEGCANTIAECCICRVKKVGIQRIYMA